MRTIDPGWRVALTLSTLLFLFVLRVLGQVLVHFFDAQWLPPMEQWQSGLLPYPILLASQVMIIALLIKVCVDVARGDGFFSTTRTWFRGPAMWFGYIYFAGMLVRYVVRMNVHPEARWFGGTIPIVFHCVLASFIIVFSRAHRATV
jgi:hypothetical protein